MSTQHQEGDPSDDGDLEDNRDRGHDRACHSGDDDDGQIRIVAAALFILWAYLRCAISGRTP